MKLRRFLCAVAISALPAMAMADVRPLGAECEVTPMYGYRANGEPGRIVRVSLVGPELKGALTVDAKIGKYRETSVVNLDADSVAHFEVMLPAEAVSKKPQKLTLTFKGEGKPLKSVVEVEPMRHWTVYLYNHSHVDVGYTNTHKNVETLHRTNLLEGIRIGRETAGHVDGARFVWNPEVTWPIEREWVASPERRDEILKAIKAGTIGVDASYVNLNTSICTDEEMFHILKFSRELQDLTGVPVDVFQQFDIPGISWGFIPVLVQEGVKYIISWPNTDRGGLGHNNGIDGMPFWWVGPDGKSKVLFLQPGKYSNSGSMDKGWITGRPWFGQRNASLIPPTIRMGSANVDFTPKLIELEKEGYPLDVTVLSWTLWDNSPVDEDVPYAVQEWNSRYAYPKIIISNGHDIMADIEARYGDSLPEISGDYTEYWTDGLGTAADMTAINRRNKERINQAETAWSMLSGGRGVSRKDFDEAWRYIQLGSEHTWDFENPSEPYFEDAILRVKKGYFKEAEELSRRALEESLGLVVDKSNGALGPAEGPAGGGVTVVNTQSWPRAGVVALSPAESLRGNCVINGNGRKMLSQRLSSGELLFLADTIAPFGVAHYRVVDEAPISESGVKAAGYGVDNGLVAFEIDPESGNIVSLRMNGDEYNYIDTAIDGGANSACWLPANVDAPEAAKVTSVEIAEQGPLLVEYLVKSQMKGCREVERRVRLVAGCPWVEITNMVDKLPLKEKDGVHFGFGFNLPGSRTLVDIPWGVMEIEKDQWSQANRNWYAMQRWLDISNADRGVAWCSLDAPLFESGKRTANIALGWGGQGPWETVADTTPAVYSWVMNNHWHTNFPQTQDGPVEFRYRLMPHAGFDAVAVNRFGVEQAQPLLSVPTSSLPEVKAPIALDNDAVYVTILKSTGKDGEQIVHLRSISDKAESVNVTVTDPNKALWLCSVSETPTERVEGILNIAPYGMITLMIKPQRQQQSGIIQPGTEPNECQQRLIDRGYGMFVHFGMNTFNGLEWSEGKDPASLYNPTALDCDQWVRTARDAGFRYVLLVTKHHDGFCMWDSALTDYVVMSSPVPVDVVKAVSDACRKYGLEFGIYYSLWDRHESTYTSDDFKDYLQFMDGQLTELLTSYGDICEIWFDGAWDKPAADWNIPHIYELVKSLQPGCAVGVNNNLVHPCEEDGGGFDILWPDEMIGEPNALVRYFPVDFRLADPKIAHRLDAKIYDVDGRKYYLPFEHTVCLSLAGNWFQKENPAPVRDQEELRELFYWTTSNDNTLVINVPPDRSGRIPQHEADAIISLGRSLGIQPGVELPQGGRYVSVSAKAEASSEWDDSGDYGAAMATDGGMHTRWASRDTVAQLVVYPDPNQLFNKIDIYEYCDERRAPDNFTNYRYNRITDYTVDVWRDGAWSPIYVSTSPMGDCKSITLPEPISAERVRLNIRAALDSPSIYEFNLIHKED